MVDLLVIGGGINGAGIARDAAGRGLSVLLVERHDLASATSSWSSKLIHGGLRYLEQYEFRLVSEALAEREVLLDVAAHLVWPARFVMPHVPELRPRWMIRAGLFLYDHLARLARLPGSAAVRLDLPPLNAGLKPELKHGFIYSDCRVDDARLVVANAMSARELGATILTRTECVAARRADGLWHARLRAADGAESEVTARAIVNAAGPWVKEALNDHLGQPSGDAVRLVKGSHVVFPRLYAGDHAFILQNDDGRVVFMIPYEDAYTLVGTTDVPVEGDPAQAACSDDEAAYLCRAVNRYLAQPVAPAQAVWRYAGVRPLYDDGSANPSAVTRDYTLRVDAEHAQAAVLSVFGGKITTYRKLAEHALEKLAPFFPGLKLAWTDRVSLPGSDFAGADRDTQAGRLRAHYPGLPHEVLHSLFRRHGTRAAAVLGDARTPADLGTLFGAGLTEREMVYFRAQEWATTAEDVLWRRTKCGLHLSAMEQAAVTAWFARQPPLSPQHPMR